MKRLIYINPPDSGLGDRLLDVLLLYSYSILLNCSEFYVHWEYNSSTRQCLKLNHLLYYIKFPPNIYFFNKRDVNNKYLINNPDNNIFSDCLAASSIFTFNEKYLKNDLEKQSQLEKIYYETFKQIHFMNIPDHIKDIFTNKEVITIHLRRTDKINNNISAHGVNNQELTFLNEKTHKFIETNILQGNKNICIVSDDKNCKNEYYSKYKDSANLIIFDEICQVKQAYYDLYCLCNANAIFMSQMFSTFSIVAALMTKTKLLYYPFNYGRLYEFNQIQYNFYKYNNFIFYI
jgi:hypothetical protein